MHTPYWTQKRTVRFTSTNISRTERSFHVRVVVIIADDDGGGGISIDPNRVRENTVFDCMYQHVTEQHGVIISDVRGRRGRIRITHDAH